MFAPLLGNPGWAFTGIFFHLVPSLDRVYWTFTGIRFRFASRLNRPYPGRHCAYKADCPPLAVLEELHAASKAAGASSHSDGAEGCAEAVQLSEELLVEEPTVAWSLSRSRLKERPIRPLPL